MGIKTAIRGKGLIGTVKAGFIILKMFGLRKEKMLTNIRRMTELVNRYDGLPTYPVPAVVLSKYWHLLQKFNEDLEFAVHGLTHIDYTTIAKEECYKHLKEAKKIFEDIGIKEPGFRAPYLRFPEHGVKILSELGYAYDSSSTLYYDVVEEKNSEFLKAIDFYSPIKNFEKGTFKRFPVCLPDDEMLIDRLGIKNGMKIGKIWEKVMEQSLKDSKIFVLQLHPSRFPTAKEGLEHILKKAKNEGIEISPLRSASDGCICITGDVDILCIYDYIWR